MRCSNPLVFQDRVRGVPKLYYPRQPQLLPCFFTLCVTKRAKIAIFTARPPCVGDMSRCIIEGPAWEHSQR